MQAAAAGQAPPGAVPAAARVEAARLRLERAEAAQRAKVVAWQQRRAAEAAAGIKRGPGRGRPPLPPEAHFKVHKARAALERAQAKPAAAGPQAPARPGSGPGPVRNITDPDARLMPVRGGGFIEGYNTQNVDSEDGLIIATELTQDTTDASWYEPMLRQAEAAAAFITARRPPPGRPAPDGQGQPPGTSGSAASASLIGLFLADAGYLSEHNLTIDGPDRLIAAGKTRDLEHAARARGEPAAQPWASKAITAMAARLQTDDGIAAYHQRGHIAETPGHIKHNMRFRQLSVRGKPKASAEWTFTCAVYNLFKAITTGHLTTTALAALPSRAGPQATPA